MLLLATWRWRPTTAVHHCPLRLSSSRPPVPFGSLHPQHSNISWQDGCNRVAGMTAWHHGVLTDRCPSDIYPGYGVCVQGNNARVHTDTYRQADRQAWLLVARWGCAGRGWSQLTCSAMEDNPLHEGQNLLPGWQPTASSPDRPDPAANWLKTPSLDTTWRMRVHRTFLPKLCLSYAHVCLSYSHRIFQTLLHQL